MDCFSKLTETVYLRTTRHRTLRWPSRNDGFFCMVPGKLLSDSEKHFTAQFFTDVCRILVIANLYTTTYQTQTNGPAERFYRTILAAPCHYVADHPRIRGESIDAPTYAYSTQPHSGTVFAPFKLVLARPPLTLAIEARSGIMSKQSPMQWYLQ